MLKNCFHCCKEIKIRPCYIKDKNFCSKECYKEYLASIRYIDRVCVVCGKKFRALSTEVGRGKGTCCSVKCASKLSSATKKKLATVRVCQSCGKQFEARTDQIKLGKAKYCSNKCFGQYLKTIFSGQVRSLRIKKNCKICGETFEVTPYFKDREICSAQCRALNGSRHNKYSDSSIERKIKSWLIENKIKFNFQYRVPGVAFPDFFVEDRLCIFADGDYWHNYPNGLDKDRHQDIELSKKGFKILRFWEHDINDNFESVTSKINLELTGENK
jgi:very-short-patch-repair endonuclease